jgi:hypothetical protein
VVKPAEDESGAPTHYQQHSTYAPYQQMHTGHGMIANGNHVNLSNDNRQQQAHYHHPGRSYGAGGCPSNHLDRSTHSESTDMMRERTNSTDVAYDYYQKEEYKRSSSSTTGNRNGGMCGVNNASIQSCRGARSKQHPYNAASYNHGFHPDENSLLSTMGTASMNTCSMNSCLSSYDSYLAMEENCSVSATNIGGNSSVGTSMNSSMGSMLVRGEHCMMHRSHVPANVIGIGNLNTCAISADGPYGDTDACAAEVCVDDAKDSRFALSAEDARQQQVLGPNDYGKDPRYYNYRRTYSRKCGNYNYNSVVP